MANQEFVSTLSPAAPAGPALASRPARGAIDPAISLNFSIAKVLSILCVVAGHWFVKLPLWVPVTMGLIIFAFSSGYLTARLYGPDVDRPRFWRKKLERLGLRSWVILAFLSVVVTVQGRTVLHWHTLVHAAGMSGVLNWMGIRNHSALGYGMWFFTLLLLFYLAYPFLARIGQSASAAIGTALLSTLAAVWLQDHVHVGHELWLTALGFVLGTLFGARQPAWRPAWALLLALAACGALLVLNALGHKEFNSLLIALAGIGISAWLATARPRWPAPARSLARLDAWLLEVFLLHVYLFVHPSGLPLLDFFLSLALIGAAAFVVHLAAERLAVRVFGRS
jgi:hypothetical protein